MEAFRIPEIPWYNPIHITKCIGEGGSRRATLQPGRRRPRQGPALKTAASPAPVFDDAEEPSPSPTTALGAMDTVSF